RSFRFGRENVTSTRSKRLPIKASFTFFISHRFFDLNAFASVASYGHLNGKNGIQGFCYIVISRQSM
ncbi:MAG: hypothetical protein ACXW1R_02280, partial [Halobacteriota archaeon]